MFSWSSECILTIDLGWIFILILAYARFFRQFLLYFFLHQMSIGLFRLMGSLGRNMIVANTFGSFAMLVVMALGGYIISRGRTEILSLSACLYISFHTFIHFSCYIVTDDIPSWWIWGFWFSPLMYAQNAASNNEFLGHSWDKVIPLYHHLFHLNW